MHIVKNWVNLSLSLAVLNLTAALAGCGGSSGDGSSAPPTAGAPVVSGSPPPSPPGGSGSGGSAPPPGGGSGGAPPGGGSGSAATILFEQPQESGIAGHLVVPLASHTPPPKGVFELVLWQPNPNLPSGQLVPTTWDASSQTGFTPSSSLLSGTQLGFQNKVGTSTAQMDGDIVGAYLNSADLPGSPVDQKMMITPQFTFDPGNEPVPFANSSSSLSASMDLQIPTAVGKDTYVVADLLFKDPNGVRLSFGVKIFSNGVTQPIVGSGYDVPSNSYMLNSPLGVDQRFVTLVQGSASATGAPWLGWRHFEWSISQAQFVAGLNYLISQYPGKVQLTDPTQYVLAEVHLNAEFHFQPAPAELGWSMSGWKVWTTGT